MAKPGPLNLLTDVCGLAVVNADCEKARSGVTLIRCRDRFVCGVDVRGGAPGVRETDTLAPENLVGRADAILLAGGSVFGLGAADGAAAALSAAGVGLRLSDKGPAIPIVAAAVLHDLGNDGDKNWGARPPYWALGAEAAQASIDADDAAPFALGAVGAGRGAMAGLVKGGLGSASIALEGGVVVAAIAAVNPAGSVYLADGETFCAWPYECGEEFGGRRAPTAREPADPFPAHSRLATTRPAANTTIAVVATNADLSGVEAKRMAMTAHDGLARAVRPAHTQYDGDVCFSIATAAMRLPADGAARLRQVASICAAGADCLARAVARGVFEANRSA